MTPQIERRGAPSLFGARPVTSDGSRVHSLLDLMHEGFHLLFLLKTGSAPPGEDEFMDRVGAFLGEFEREARKLRAEGDDIDAAKYAYCAALDEIILGSPFPIRDAWERRPLQLALFGDQLAGEHFFDRLDELRGKGGTRLQALQVFHMCLLLGFRGKYALDSSDKLAYMTARLGDEIAHIKGKSAGFAPRAGRPDQVVNKLRSNVPLWAVCAVFALAGMAMFTGLRASLNRDAQVELAAYHDLVKLAPRPASLTVTLP
ncbi:type VI secretion system protein ImpK [Pseudoduganella flava]|uniref:DotU family type IV/VI secretion system protein n=1 Tax=Pseudoduganella flava TaxID=871742 RepID=A0A562PES6_9BURK|nr:type IVB secretion system protein IcmH/DotU [Pseudoduganella flava]QGZ38918.1 DotU family type IV/VI secretion system protein [Pseudoduganella flava]TWI42992.1 type VI secretion system protein ImpK [Pseudoduganella flava]